MNADALLYSFMEKSMFTMTNKLNIFLSIGKIHMVNLFSLRMEHTDILIHNTFVFGRGIFGAHETHCQTKII